MTVRGAVSLMQYTVMDRKCMWQTSGLPSPFIISRAALVQQCNARRLATVADDCNIDLSTTVSRGRSTLINIIRKSIWIFDIGVEARHAATKRLDESCCQHPSSNRLVSADG